MAPNLLEIVANFRYLDPIWG